VFQCIREIRSALGDDERELIRMVSGRGYVLDAEVRGPEKEAASKPDAPLAKPPTIAVMPMTTPASDAYLAEMAANVGERLTGGLARIDRLRVVTPPGTSTAAADFVVSAELQKSGGRWEARARMTSASTGEVRWSHAVTVSAEEGDLALQQSRLAAGFGHPLALRINALQNSAALMEGGPRKISPFFIPAAIVNLAAGQVSMRFGAKGPNEATATACTTSAHSIGDSFRIIQHNDADVMIAGGAEAAITPMGVGGFAAMRALSTRNDAPQKASRPWDKDRDGFVIGEGAGILILEELEFARKRGAPILAEVAGYGMSGDAYHMTQPAPEHEGGFRVMRNAVRDAGVTPDVVGYVNAHGTSTPIGDALEAKAIRNFFGERKIAVSSTKSMTGHLLGGAGGLEAGITVLALRDQMLPPTVNLENPEPDTAGMDLVPNAARKAEIEYAMSNSFGFGGTNGALLFRRWNE